MRIAYDNIIDDLVGGTSATIVASSELTSYPITNVQDQRLTTQWGSDSTTSQTIVCEFDTLPEFPDYATGTSYIQTAWSTVDSWTATLATLSVTNYTGILTVTATSNSSAYITRTGLTIPASSTIKIKARSTLSSTLTILNSAGSTLGTITGVNSAYSILSVTTATAATTLNIYTNNSTVGTALEIDGIYTGTGQYTTQLIDQSGNARHGTIYGATPDGEGGLVFDGVNDYVVISSTQTIPDIFHFDAILTIPNHATQIQVILGIGGSGVPRLLIDRSINNRNLRISYWNGGSTVTMESANFFPSTTIPVHCSITVNWLTGLVLVYQNGVLFTNHTMVSMIKPSALLWYIGNQAALSATNALGGTIRQARIYNRALSADEILHIYNEEPFNTESFGLVADWTLDAQYKVSTAAILGHNIKTGTTVKIEANNSNEWSDPAVSETMVVNPDNILKFLDDTYIYKYWRFTFSGQANLKIGRLWLGDYLSINPSSLDDFTVTKKRDDIVVYGKNRQKYASIGNGWRQIEFTFPRSNPVMISELTRFIDTVGHHGSFIFCNFDSLRDYELVEPLYCSISDDTGFSHARRQFYTYSLKLEEDR